VTKRNAILLSVVALVGAVGAFWHFALAPKRERISKLDADITKQEQARDAANSEAAGYEKSKAAYDANYAKIVRLGKAVPADDDVRSLLVQVENAAQRDKVDFRLINVGGGTAPASAASPDATAPSTPGAQTVPGSDIAMLPFSFAFTGKYFSLAQFLGKVDRFVTVRNAKTDATGRLLLLTSFSLKPDNTLGYPNLRAEVGATTYVTPPPTSLPDAGKSAPESPSAGAGSASPSDASTPPTTTATATGAVR
jgi:Tfp pilus assembly protein PilO